MEKFRSRSKRKQYDVVQSGISKCGNPQVYLYSLAGRMHHPLNWLQLRTIFIILYGLLMSLRSTVCLSLRPLNNGLNGVAGRTVHLNRQSVKVVVLRSVYQIDHSIIHILCGE